MNEPRVVQNKYGRWEIRQTVKDPTTGKIWTQRQSLGVGVQTEAQAKAELAKRSAPVNRVWSVELAILLYLQHRPDQKWNLVAPRRILGHWAPEVIDALECDVYVWMRRTEGVADATIRRELGAVRAALNWVAKRQKVKIGQVDTSMVKDGQARTFFLAEQEEADFYRSAELWSVGLPRLDRVTRFVALALDTAARKEAIETLTWDRVDLVAGTVDYRDPTKPPSRKRRTVVPISKRLRPVLERAHRERTGPWVLDHPGDIRSAYETFTARLPGRLSEANPHDLRRTWATLAARAGVQMWDIAGVLGDSIETVTKHYAHHSPNHLKNAVDRRF